MIFSLKRKDKHGVKRNFLLLMIAIVAIIILDFLRDECKRNSILIEGLSNLYFSQDKSYDSKLYGVRKNKYVEPVEDRNIYHSENYYQRYYHLYRSTETYQEFYRLKFKPLKSISDAERFADILVDPQLLEYSIQVLWDLNEGADKLQWERSRMDAVLFILELLEVGNDDTQKLLALDFVENFLQPPFEKHDVKKSVMKLRKADQVELGLAMTFLYPERWASIVENPNNSSYIKLYHYIDSLK